MPVSKEREARLATVSASVEKPVQIPAEKRDKGTEKTVATKTNRHTNHKKADTAMTEHTQTAEHKKNDSARTGDAPPIYSPGADDVALASRLATMSNQVAEMYGEHVRERKPVVMATSYAVVFLTNTASAVAGGLLVKWLFGAKVAPPMPAPIPEVPGLKK
jgi:hypothetical protein